MRRKRKTRYIWLPMLGSDPIGGVDETQQNGFSFTFAASGSAQQASALALFPILEDTPQEEVVTANPDPNIVDFIGTDYVIKRIVGKVHITALQVTADVTPSVVVTCGFFVARADDQNPLLPIGASTTPLAIDNYDPNYVDNIREPWIWRRSWILANAASTNASTNKFGWPLICNAQYGSVMDGPHIDAKTGRRVRNDERLWFVASARGITTNGAEFQAAPSSGGGAVDGYLDVRVLGALRRARNRSNF